MKFTDEVIDRVIGVINAKTHNQESKCSVCGQEEWTLSDGLVYFPLQENIRSVSWEGRGMPCVAMICSTCGNTQFLNAITLGLGDLLLSEEDEEEARPTKGRAKKTLVDR